MPSCGLYSYMNVTLVHLFFKTFYFYWLPAFFNHYFFSFLINSLRMSFVLNIFIICGSWRVQYIPLPRILIYQCLQWEHMGSESARKGSVGAFLFSLKTGSVGGAQLSLVPWKEGLDCYTTPRMSQTSICSLDPLISPQNHYLCPMKKG